MRTVVIESDGPLSLLPWPVLVRTNGHFWSEDFAIRVRSGGRGRPGPARVLGVQRALVVGEPTLTEEDNLTPLPDARQEAEKVSALFSRSILLTGPAASWTVVRDRLRDAELFHFAGHGYGGEGGGLLLKGTKGSAELLRANDIQHLNLAGCSLVVLSGCSTGTGERNGPGNPESLVRAFLRAGAREVVASSWNLDSTATQVLMRDLYAALLKGQPVAESLRIAAASVRSLRGYAHPYYWAGLEAFSGN